MQNQKIKFIFWGTPAVASDTLEILKFHGYIPIAIVSSPDAKSGRGLRTQSSPASTWAEKNNIPCLKPEKINADFIAELSTFDSQLNIVVAYGKILPQEIIDMPKYGTLNIHYSLLPKYRGASPLESALLNGETVTGVTIQKMVKKLDAGDIIATKEVPIESNTTKENLRNTLILQGAKLLCEIIPKYLNNEVIPLAQNEQDATHCSKIKKEDGLIDPNGDPILNYNKYRAYYGWPGIYFFTSPPALPLANGREPKRIKITKAHLEENQFVIDRIIPEGGKEIDYSLWKNS